jgi:hypothetical protein
MVMMLAPHKNPVVERPEDDSEKAGQQAVEQPEAEQPEGEQPEAVQQEPEQEPEKQEESAPALAEAQETE